MIIQCGQCATKFRIDDARVTEKGVKVRCAKCKHVFTVSKPIAVMPEEVAISMPVASVASSVPDVTVPSTSGDEASVASFPAKLEESVSVSMVESSAVGEHEQGEALLSTVERESVRMAEPESVTAPGPNDQLDSGVTASPAPDSTMDVFFDEPAFFPDGHRKSSTRHSSSPDEALFDRNEFLPSSAADEVISRQVNSVPLPETPPEQSVATGKVLTDVGAKFTQISPDEAPFLPSVTPPLPDLALPTTGKADERTVLPAAAHAATGTAADKDTPSSSAAFTVEPPPSSSVRRQQSGSGSWLWWVLLVVALGALAFYLYPRFVGTAAPVTSQGSLTISAVKPSFVKNSEGIEVLLLEGEAVNGFRTSRQSIRAKGLVFAADGRVIAEKTALCGTSLTKEQVIAMPLEQVLTAQSNPGSATSPTAPGAAVSCIVVLDNVPTEGKDFALEVIDSVEVTPGN